MTKFADIDTARKIIKKLFPEAKNVRFVEHGYDNLVGLVDKKYALRFPRYDFAYLRDLFEKQILLDLSAFEEIIIPKILGEGRNPYYIITSFVPGEHISEEDINHWPENEQKRYGQQVAKFAHFMHSSITVEKAIEIQKLVGLKDFSFYEYALSNYIFPVLQQDRIAKEYYKKWEELQYSTSKVVIHNDLQNRNLLFKGYDLVGVIDFGDAQIGSPEQELRQLYRLDESILQSAIVTYEQLSGLKLNDETIKIWAIIQELASYANNLANNKTDHHGFLSATKYLEKWLPEGNWG